ncbi:MAG: CotH kinase family protein [Deltaproteobacteria bacterium]|nr:CotH kinase family protein [Deltaproteobacteria bacterium]
MSARERARFFGVRRLRWKNFRLWDAFVLSLPVWLVLTFLVGTPVARYLDARSFQDWWTRTESLERLANARIATLTNLPEALALRLRLDAESQDPRWLRLHVDRDVWNEWQGAPLALSGEWTRASIVRGRDVQPVKLRKRGDTGVHWLTPKKSFTLKTPKKQLYKGHRRLVYSGKTPVEQVAVNSLARRYGLLAPDTFLSPVFVNDRFYGLFRASEVIDESLLRRLARMPGDIFRGDTAERGENFRGVRRNLWHNSNVWDRVARNDRPTRPAASGLERLLDGVAAGSPEDLDEVWRILDRDEMARLLAFLLVAGDPYHMTNLHNQFWYEDPSSGRLHPIVWDIRLLSLEDPPQHPLNSGFTSLLRDPRLFDAAMQVLAVRRADETLLAGVSAQLEMAKKRFEGPLEYEALRAGTVPDLTPPDEVRERLEANARLVAEWVDDARVSVRMENGLADVRVEGRAAVSLVGVKGADESTRVFADRNRNGRFDAEDPELPLEFFSSDSTQKLVRPERLLAGVETREWIIQPAQAHYRLFIQGVGRPQFENALTGAPIVAGKLESGTLLTASPGFDLWSFPLVEARGAELTGTVELSETLRVGEGATLSIAPGTRLRMARDVSIFARGRVLALGTAEAPILIEPLDPRQPWGAFALLGPGASGSRFEHVQFVGGGGAELDAVEFKGMVDVHWARDVRFSECLFADNLRSDDALNAVHADVTVERSRFLRTNADAVDYDYSTGNIVDNVFEASGNDAIDLMTSAPVIVGNRIHGSVDKGISVGEASEPWIEGNSIRACVTGIEVKDRSRPWLIANEIRENEIGLLQKAKNWRYGGGGQAKWIGPALAGNATDYRADESSTWTRLEVSERPGWLSTTPLAETRFFDDFDLAWDEWQLTGDRARLAKRQGDLVLQPRRGLAEARREQEIVPGRATLIVEYVTRNLSEASLRWDGPGGKGGLELPASASRGERRMAAVVLPESGIRELSFRALGEEERDGPAELRVHALYLREAHE